MIDLHTHSYYSDGTLSPTELVFLAESLKMKALAITDHDTTMGLNEAISAAKNKNVNFIPGIELSVIHKPGELHILGLGLKNWEDAPILRKINNNRKSRNKQIIEIMNLNGLGIKYTDLEKLTKGTIGRPHFAEWMLRNGYVNNMNQAFREYLSRGKSFYIPREMVSLEEATDFIHNCRGFALIAHPLNIAVNFNTLLEKIDNWLDIGIDGFEGMYSGAKKNMTKRLLDYGRTKECLITGGSDFHGKNKPQIKPGRTKKMGIISDEFLPQELLHQI